MERRSNCRSGTLQARSGEGLIFWSMHVWQLCPLKTCLIGFEASPSPTIGPHTPLSLSMTFQTRFFLKSSVALKITIKKCPLTFYALPFTLSHSRPLTVALTGCEKSRSTRPPRFVMINLVSRYYSRWNQSNHGYCHWTGSNYGLGTEKWKAKPRSYLNRCWGFWWGTR